jgi:hypothetical protein
MGTEGAYRYFAGGRWNTARCLLHDDARHGSPTTMWGSSEGETGPPPLVQFPAVEEESADGLGEESERKSERRERRGWTVRGIMARATKRRGVSRSFPRRAGEASLCVPHGLAPWKRLNRWYPLGLCGGCFKAHAGQENEGAQESNQ